MTACAYIVYCHTCVITNKSYVGWAQSRHNAQLPIDIMNRRWFEHCGSKRSDLFPRAIAKHGVSAWKHTLLEVLSTKRAAVHAEKLWIAELRTFSIDLSLGYNMTPGGEGGQRQGLKRSAETRKKISESRKGKSPPNKGKKASATARFNMSQSHKGHVTPLETRLKQSLAMKGRIFSEDHRRHVSEALKGHIVSLETREKIRETLKERADHG